VSALADELGSCTVCGKPVCDEDEYAEHCSACYANWLENRAEAAWERSQEGECFRGGEAAAYEAEQMDKIQRELKR
jgi:hypothetical protein